jgi:hypothetical protein
MYWATYYLVLVQKEERRQMPNESRMIAEGLVAVVAAEGLAAERLVAAAAAAVKSGAKQLYTVDYLLGVKKDVGGFLTQAEALKTQAANLRRFLELVCHHPAEVHETVDRTELEDSRGYGGDREVTYRDKVCGICGRVLETWKKC